MRLANKVCVITGAGSGIGQATARLFAREGAKFVVADIAADSVRRTADGIGQDGGESRPVQVDVTQSHQVQRMLRETIGAYGQIDVLINNAGFGFAASVEETSEEDWDRLMAVNLKGVFLGCKYVVPLMRRQHAGVIINTASVAAVVGVRERAAYCASKGAVAALTKAMAIDHVSDGIRINCIAPGTVETPYFSGIFAQSPDPEKMRKEIEARQVMNRMGTPEEIAQGMLFLASDDSSFVTGTTLFVDGGMSAW